MDPTVRELINAYGLEPGPSRELLAIHTPLGLLEPTRMVFGEMNAGTVACVGFAAARAAVVQIPKNLEPLLDHRMGLGSLDVGDKTDATGVVFEVRPVE
jgi:hypothetical protein